MILTPSNTGNVAAGAGVGLFAWGAFLKSDKIPWIKKLMTPKRKESTLSWVNSNKGMTLLGLEAVNFSIHGVTEANGVFFALGNTCINIIMLWVWLPIRLMSANKQHVNSVLKKVVV